MTGAFTFSVLDWSVEALNWLIRVLIAAACGFVIGMERKARSKEAGVRTHAIVCIASALIMIVSKYSFTDLGYDTYDAARIAAQIVSGIGFLGAGMIFYRRDILHGLTTAAGVWATAGIGMAIGSGMIILGLAGTAIIMFVQIVLHMHVRTAKYKAITVMKAIIKIEDKNDITDFKQLFGINKFLKFRTYRNDGDSLAELEFMTKLSFSSEQLYELTRTHSYIVSVESNEEI